MGTRQDEQAGFSTERPRERAVIVGVNLPDAWLGGKGGQADLPELAQLADTAGADVVGRIEQTRPKPESATFVGSGKLAELKEMVVEREATLVIFDNDLSPAQGRNLEKHLEVNILDRTELILDIFAKHASTRQSRLQVELAQLQYLLPRLTRLWSHLERQAGGIGTRGPGETQLETDRRLIARRVKLLKERLARVAVSRGVQSRTRKRARVRTVALVGYTNAGKSTLFNRLTRERVYAADQLFATLDTTLRRVHVPGADPVVLSDTVGFIRDLPHDLVAAFRATLSEAAEADLVVHVVDASAPDRDVQVEAVERVLAEIGADRVPRLTALNKIDAAGLARGVERDAYGTIRTVRLSALTGEGCAELVSALAERFPAGPARADDAAAVGSTP